MKKNPLLLSVFLLLLVNACTIQKRTHRSGYYIDWHKKSINNVVERITVKNDFVASADHKINLPEKGKLNFSAQPKVACGDTIILISGEKIICQIIEINETTIKYKQCDNIEGPIYTNTKQSVLKIVYINGKSELISSSTTKDIASNTSINNPANACNDTLFFKDGKTMVCEIVEVKSDYIKYKKCDSLNETEYYFDRYKVKRFVNSIAVEQPKPKEDYSSPKKQVAKTLSPSSVAAFLFSLLSIALFFVALSSGGSFVLIFSFISFLLAIILGIIGLIQINNNKEIYKGKVFSILAFVLPAVTFFGLILLIVLFFGF